MGDVITWRTVLSGDLTATRHSAVAFSTEVCIGSCTGATLSSDALHTMLYVFIGGAGQSVTAVFQHDSSARQHILMRPHDQQRS